MARASAKRLVRAGFLAGVGVVALSACQPTRGAAAVSTNEPVEATGAAVQAPGAGHTAASAGSGAHSSDGWLAWSEASALALAENRPMMLFVYADWCPRCRELEPVLDRPEVRQAGCNKLVMVRQNQDEEPAWLRTTVGDPQTYVPRVIFLNPDGTMRAEVSPHPRYPLFYTPSMVEALMSNMRAVAGC